MERLLRLRGRRWIASVGLRLGLVVRITMAIWRPLERRWSGLAGVHGARVGVRAFERRAGSDNRRGVSRGLKQSQRLESEGRRKQRESNEERQRTAAPECR